MKARIISKTDLQNDLQQIKEHIKRITLSIDENDTGKASELTSVLIGKISRFALKIRLQTGYEIALNELKKS